ncbi:MAG: type 4a pilus biogenesis protein PilO [Myxococcales bacterium]|nr:type 4a pilus biogenesis protein PilO [Myxococcales bacterium]
MEQLIDRIAKASNAAKFGGLAAAVVLITAANFFLFIQEIEDKIEGQKSTQSALNQSLAEKQEIAQNLNERRREMDLLEQRLAEALTELPDRKEIDELLAQLNDIGKKSGLEISVVEPGPESMAAFFARIPIKMVVSGNYHEIAMFLQEVSNMRRIVNVDNIRLGSGALRNDKVILTSEFLATTFRFVEQPKPQGAGGPKR